MTIVLTDITKMEVDAIVNAANTELKQGGGVCGAIFKTAGAEKMQAACDKLAPIKTGEAVITPGFDLKAKYVIHTVGPVYEKYEKEQSESLLRAAYTNSLKIAVDNKIQSIAFPLISSGIYGYPKEEALRVATSSIKDFITDHDIDVALIVYDKTSFVVSQKLLGEVKNYIDEHYVESRKVKRTGIFDNKRRSLFDVGKKQSKVEELMLSESELAAPAVAEESKIKRTGLPSSLEHLVGNLDEPFSRTLLRLIDAKGKNDVEVYKRANLDRKLFSKIRSNKNYMPSKRTAIALAIALELSLAETDDLLQRAGFALSHAAVFDVIVEYFIANKKYDIFEINEVLFEYDQPLLGG